MSTYTVVSDIHANWPALNAVLEDAPDTDGLICLGDLVGLCGFPSEVVTFCSLGTELCLQGNHDLSVIEWGEGHVNNEALSYFELETTLDTLTYEAQCWVNDRPTYKERHDDALLCAHAEPHPETSSGLERGNNGIPPRHAVEAATRSPEWADIVALGHTHEQHVVDMADYDGDNSTVLVNPGSVGMPIDGVAEYAIVDTDQSDVELRSTQFDTDRVIERLRALDVPIEWWHKN
jgi:predicted phosphodiesterase